METINYKSLYLLQDKILKIVFQEYTEFYLTGGTCLNRFYFDKRYSDDLDFFTNSSHTFAYSAKEIIDRITQATYTIEQQVDSMACQRSQASCKRNQTSGLVPSH